MEQLFLRFPHLSEAICGQLNDESLATWTGVSRSLNMYLTEQKLFEVRIIKATIENYQKRKYGWRPPRWAKVGIRLVSLLKPVNALSSWV